MNINEVRSNIRTVFESLDNRVGSNVGEWLMLNQHYEIVHIGRFADTRTICVTRYEIGCLISEHDYGDPHKMMYQLMIGSIGGWSGSRYQFRTSGELRDFIERRIAEGHFA